MQHSLRVLLAQHNDGGQEQAIYYLSKTMIGAKFRYNPIEKECLALVFTVQKMQHYIVGRTIQVLSKIKSLRLLRTRPSALNGCLVKWAILLPQYGMKFLQQKAIKGQVLTNFLTDNPTSKAVRIYDGHPDEVQRCSLRKEPLIVSMAALL